MTLSLDATVRAHDHLVACRRAAGWDFDPEYGWASPEGMSASDWEDEGYPFPEDPAFPAWSTAYYHYEAVDAERDLLPTDPLILS